MSGRKPCLLSKAQATVYSTISRVVPATILMYEQARHPIPFDIANKLASILEISSELLYDDFSNFIAAPYTVVVQKKYREAQEMNQREFAEHIGVQPCYYYKLEAGNRRPSRGIYLKVMQAVSNTNR